MPIILFMLACLDAQATSLVSRYQFINADQLPKNVWVAGVSMGRFSARGSFNQNGTKVSNQDYFSKNLQYGHLLDEVNDPLERNLAEAAFGAYGRALSDTSGRVYNDVSVEQKTNTFILGRGLSHRSSLFFVFPVVTLSTRFQSRFVPSQSLSQLADELKSEGQLTRSREIVQKSQNALRTRLDENNYNNSYPSEVTSLANVHVNYRYQALQNKNFKVASDSFLIVPAGKKFSENDFLPMRINEEQLSLRQGLTAEWTPYRPTSLSSSVYYHKRFAFKKAQRIPLNDVSPISSDIDPDTRVKYGDAFGTSAQLNFKASQSLTFYAGQVLEYKLRDHYSGTRYDLSRYDYMGADSDQNLGTGYLGLSLNTIDYFLSQKFIIPMDLNLQYSFANLGKNTFQNNMLALNVMVFYQ